MNRSDVLQMTAEPTVPHDRPVGRVRPDCMPTEAVVLNRALLAESGVFGFAPLDIRSRSFILLRSQILHRFHRPGGRILAVTSTQPENGKTFVTANLAAALSLIHPTVLVDLDLRRPRLAGRFGITPSSGIDDYLDGTAAWPSTGTRIAGADLTIHGARESRADSASLLAAPRLAVFLTAIRNHPAQPICIVDTPPVLVLDDIMLIARNVDAVLMIVEEGRTRGSDIAQALRILSPTPVIGSVLNKSLTGRSVRNMDGYYYDKG